MSDEQSISWESPAVQAHVEIMQAIIERMASNSASCKAWCIALVSAALVIVGDKGRPWLALIAFIPTALFLVLDAYYLALERDFRRAYNRFVDKLYKNEISLCDIYFVSLQQTTWKEVLKAVGSFSVWPFYGMLGLMIIVAMMLVIR